MVNVQNLIVGHERSSYSDWPGKISTILFTQGCDLLCPTCHNASIAYKNLDKVRPLDLEKIFTYIESKTPWLDGVVITGGEPLIHLQSLIDLCMIIKDRIDKPIKLDTNGMHPVKLKEIVDTGLIDTVAMDIKGPYSLYPVLVGYPTKDYNFFKNKVTTSIEVIVKSKIKAYFRTTIVPLNYKTENQQIVKSYVPKGYLHKFQKYNQPQPSHIEK